MENKGKTIEEQAILEQGNLQRVLADSSDKIKEEFATVGQVEETSKVQIIDSTAVESENNIKTEENAEEVTLYPIPNKKGKRFDGIKRIFKKLDLFTGIVTLAVVLIMQITMILIEVYK